MGKVSARMMWTVGAATAGVLVAVGAFAGVSAMPKRRAACRNSRARQHLSIRHARRDSAAGRGTTRPDQTLVRGTAKIQPPR
jgi:hypothetical protein